MRALWLSILLSSSALAHPMGRSDYSLRTGVEADKDGVRLVVMGEIPVPVVIEALGRQANGQRPTPDQITAYTTARQQELMASQTVTVDGQALPVDWVSSPSALNGRAIDGFFVYVVQARIPLAKLDEDATIVIADAAWPEAPMVYDADVRARSPWSLIESSAPTDWTADPSARTIRARFTR